MKVLRFPAPGVLRWRGEGLVRRGPPGRVHRLQFRRESAPTRRSGFFDDHDDSAAGEQHTSGRFQDELLEALTAHPRSDVCAPEVPLPRASSWPPIRLCVGARNSGPPRGNRCTEKLSPGVKIDVEFPLRPATSPQTGIGSRGCSRDGYPSPSAFASGRNRFAARNPTRCSFVSERQ
jgi:hypothetical protein